jgi:transitional endoplasmic reticulum ATPase
MDGTLRYNAGVSIDDEVTIKPIELESAKTLQLSPTQPIEFSPDFIEYVHERIINMPLMNDNSIVINVVGRKLQLVVSKINPNPSRIVWETKLQISKKPVKAADEKIKTIRYEDIGGLKTEIEAIREMVEIPMKNPEVFRKLGIEPPKGVLLYGPPGTGKTLLAKAVASETDAHFITLNGPEIMSKYYGQVKKI